MSRIAILAAALTLCAPLAAAQSNPVAVAAPSAHPATRSGQIMTGADFASETYAVSLARSLRTQSAEARAAGLAEAVFLAAFYNDLADLSPLLTDLLRVLEEDPDPRLRVMASQAVCHIGNPEAVLAMARIAAADRDPWVRSTVLRAAAALAGEMP